MQDSKAARSFEDIEHRAVHSDIHGLQTGECDMAVNGRFGNALQTSRSTVAAQTERKEIEHDA